MYFVVQVIANNNDRHMTVRGGWCLSWGGWDWGGVPERREGQMGDLWTPEMTGPVLSQLLLDYF